MDINSIDPAAASNLDELDKLVLNNQQKKKASVGSYLFLSFLLPPLTLYLALYLAFKKNLLSAALPVFCIAYSLGNLLVGLGQIFTIAVPRQLVGIAQFGAVAPNALVVILSNITLVLAALGTILGFYFRFKSKKVERLEKWTLWFLFILINLEIFLAIYLVTVEFSWLYNITAPSVAPPELGF